MVDMSEQVQTWGRSFADPAPRSDDGGRATIATVTVPSSNGEHSVDVTAASDGGDLLIQHGFEVRAADVDWGTNAAAGVPSFAETVERLLEGMPGLLAGEIESESGTYRIGLFHPLYADGLTEHTFRLAVTEVAKARRSIDRLVREMGAQRALMADLETSLAESKESFERRMQDVEQAASVPAASAPAAGPPTSLPSPAAWSATHVAPAGGLYAWTEPDPSRAPAVTLDPGLEVRVVEWNGVWARVEASNGWTGWVDGRALIERPG